MGGIDEQAMDDVIEGGLYQERLASISKTLIERLDGEKKKYKGNNWMIAAADGQYNEALDKAKQIISEYFGV